MPQSASDPQTQALLTTAPGRAVIRRACDECRTRKVACSKEPDGCSRCEREGIRCVYSPRKPMGRPKKRRHVEQDGLDDLSQPWPLDGPTGDGNASRGLQRPYAVPNFPGLDEPTAGFGSIDIMPSLYSTPDTLPRPLLTDPFVDMDLSLFQSLETRGLFLDDSNDDDDAETQLTRGSIHHIFETIGTFILNSTSNVSNGSPAEEITPATGPAASHSKAYPNNACPCLSSIYLSLESLTTIPDDLPVAINVARSASRTAHRVIRCSICSTPLTENPLATPSIQSFQNMLLVSALLSSLSNAYARLLEIVDAAAAEAKAAPRDMHFSFRELGGVWSQLARSGGGGCMLSRGISDADLPPDIWRVAMRAILRYEIHGFQPRPGSADTSPEPQEQQEHLGLASAVRRLEERSVTRHATLDRLYEEGHPPPSWCAHVSTKPMKEGEVPQCMRIIEGARLALERLAIS